MQETDTFVEREEYLARLGVVLRMARNAAAFTQEEAAAKMGVDPSAFTRWEDGRNALSAYDLARLIRLYEFDPDLAVNPPASKIEIKRRLGPVSASARRATRRALRRPPPPADDEPA